MAVSGATGPLQGSSTEASQNRTARDHLVNQNQQLQGKTQHHQESVLVAMVLLGAPQTTCLTVTDPAATTPGLQARERHLAHVTHGGVMNQGAGRATMSRSPLNRETAAVSVSQQAAALTGIEPVLEVSWTADTLLKKGTISMAKSLLIMGQTAAPLAAVAVGAMTHSRTLLQQQQPLQEGSTTAFTVLGTGKHTTYHLRATLCMVAGVAQVTGPGTMATGAAAGAAAACKGLSGKEAAAEVASWVVNSSLGTVMVARAETDTRVVESSKDPATVARAGTDTWVAASSPVTVTTTRAETDTGVVESSPGPVTAVAASGRRAAATGGPTVVAASLPVVEPSLDPTVGVSLHTGTSPTASSRAAPQAGVLAAPCRTHQWHTRQ